MPSIFIFFAHAGFLVVASCGAGLFHERANFTKTHVVFATYPVVDAHNNDVYLRKKVYIYNGSSIKSNFQSDCLKQKTSDQL